MTPDRRAAIISLLTTRDEGLPEPRHRLEQVAPGFVHKARTRTCPDCLANGGPMIGCETCGGSGQVAGSGYDRISTVDALPDDGSRRDPMADNSVVPFGFDPTRHDLSHERDRQIEVLGQQVRPARDVNELEDANRRPYGWERERATMYRRYDYAALDRALDELRVAVETAYTALHKVYVYRWLPAESLNLATATQVDIGLKFLARRLPDPLRAPGAPAPPRLGGKVERGAGDRARSMRDAEICRAVLEALIPTADVARTWGLSVSQVNRIVQAAA